MNVLDFRRTDQDDSKVIVVDYDYEILYEGCSWGIPDDLLDREVRKLDDDDDVVAIYLADNRRRAVVLTTIEDWTLGVILDWEKPVEWRDRAGYLWNRFANDLTMYRDAVTICDLDVARYAHDDLVTDLARVCDFCNVRYCGDDLEFVVAMLVNDFMTNDDRIELE